MMEQYMEIGRGGEEEEEICEAVILAQTSSGNWQNERPGVEI